MGGSFHFLHGDFYFENLENLCVFYHFVEKQQKEHSTEPHCTHTQTHTVMAYSMRHPSRVLNLIVNWSGLKNPGSAGEVAWESKVLALKSWGLEYESQDPCNKARDLHKNLEPQLWGEKRWEDCWNLLVLAQLRVTHMFRERPWLQRKVKSERGHWTTSSDLCVCTHPCTHIPIYSHRCIHTHK